MLGYMSGDPACEIIGTIAPGEVVQMRDDDRPYLVAYTEASGVRRKFETTLFHVEVLELVAEEDRLFGTTAQRVRSVRVIEEVDIWEYYGPHGRDVCDILNPLKTLTMMQTKRLLEDPLDGIDDLAKGVEDRVKAHLERQPLNGFSRHFPDASPLNALEDAYTWVGDRALAAWGGNSWMEYDEETFEQFGDPSSGGEKIWPWSHLHFAFCDAALSVAAQDLISLEERSMLEWSWRRVFGTRPFLV